MPKGSMRGGPSLLMKRLEEKLKEYVERKRELDRVKSELHFTPEKVMDVMKDFRIRNGEVEAPRSPALEKDVKRKGLEEIFQKKNGSTYDVKGFDPRGRSESEYVRKLIMKSLPARYKENIRHRELQAKKRNKELSLGEKPTLKSVSRLKMRMGR